MTAILQRSRTARFASKFTNISSLIACEICNAVHIHDVRERLYTGSSLRISPSLEHWSTIPDMSVWERNPQVWLVLTQPHRRYKIPTDFTSSITPIIGQSGIIRSLFDPSLGFLRGISAEKTQVIGCLFNGPGWSREELLGPIKMWL